MKNSTKYYFYVFSHVGTTLRPCLYSLQRLKMFIMAVWSTKKKSLEKTDILTHFSQESETK